VDAERQYLRTTALIKAAEDWAPAYKRDVKTHAQLIRLESKWQLTLSKFFKQIADNATAYVNLGSYAGQIRAAIDPPPYNIDIIVNDQALDTTSNTFIQLSLELATDLAALGAVAGQNIYGIPLGLSSTSANIQKLGLEHVAGLVGKKVQPDGSIVDNPRAKFNITKTMRNDIAQSIKTSLAKGENTQQAIERVQQTIADPVRAERIARTESVNAYQGGLREFADQSGAVGKEWQDVGAIDVCADNTAEGPIPIDETFVSGDDQPVAHVGCRCGLRYIYKQEWDSLSL